MRKEGSRGPHTNNMGFPKRGGGSGGRPGGLGTEQPAQTPQGQDTGCLTHAHLRARVAPACASITSPASHLCFPSRHVGRVCGKHRPGFPQECSGVPFQNSQLMQPWHTHTLWPRRTALSFLSVGGRRRPRTQKSLFLGIRALLPDSVMLRARKDGAIARHSPRHVAGRALGRSCPVAGHFPSSSPGPSSGKDSEKRFGESRITLPAGPADRSWIQVFTDASFRGPVGPQVAGNTPVPDLRAWGVGFPRGATLPWNFL